MDANVTSEPANVTITTHRAAFLQLRMIFLAIAFLGILITLNVLSNSAFFGLSITNAQAMTTAFTGFAIAVLSLLAYLHVCRMIIEVQSTEQQARHMAGHDVLSGLPNRMTFTMRLTAELSRVNRITDGIAVFFLDLDKFKDVNDQLDRKSVV